MTPDRNMAARNARLAAAWRAGQKTESIAERFGLSIARVYQIQRALGLPIRARRLNIDHAAFAAEWKAGTAIADLIAKFDCSRGSIFALQAELKLPRRPRARSPIPKRSGAPVPRRAESGGGAGRTHKAPGPAGQDANAVRGAADPKAARPKTAPAANPAFWQAPAASPIAELPDDESGTIAGVIRFLRSRDYSIVGAGTGQWRIDGRRVVDASGLLELANRARARMGKTPIALDVVPCG